MDKTNILFDYDSNNCAEFNFRIHNEGSMYYIVFSKDGYFATRPLPIFITKAKAYWFIKNPTKVNKFLSNYKYKTKLVFESGECKFYSQWAGLKHVYFIKTNATDLPIIIDKKAYANVKNNLAALEKISTKQS